MAKDNEDRKKSTSYDKPKSRKRKSTGSESSSSTEEVYGKQDIVLNEGLFKLRIKSKGGSVKERGAVLETQMKACRRHPPNVNCRVETFGKMVANFGELEKKWVRDMGFEGLLWLRGRGLPRNLCYWLMTRLDPIRKVLMLPGGKDYPICKNQVHWVLGVPCGTKSVPKRLKNSQLIADVDAIHRKYGAYIKNKHKILPIGNVRKRFDYPWSIDDEYEFKVAFLIVALGDILCPTTCGRLSADLMPALSIAMECASYDWGDLVVDTLMRSGKHFAKKFYRDGYCKGCGGCTYFLAILYLDRLKRSPLKWESFPRVRVWTTKLLNEARNEDRYVGHGDYGKLECVEVAYGEHHPLTARDTMGPHSTCRSMAFEVAKIVLNGMGIDAGFGAEACSTPLYDSDEAAVEKPTTKRRRTGPADGRYFRRVGDVKNSYSEDSTESEWDDSSSSEEVGVEGNAVGEIEGGYYDEYEEKNWDEESEDEEWDPSENDEVDNSSIEDDDGISLEAENLETIDDVPLFESDSEDEDWNPTMCSDEDDKDDDDIRMLMRMIVFTPCEQMQENDGSDSLVDDNMENHNAHVSDKENDRAMKETKGIMVEKEHKEEKEENVGEKSEEEKKEEDNDGQGGTGEKENEDGNDGKNEIKGDGEDEIKGDGEDIDETYGEKVIGKENAENANGRRLSYISDGDDKGLSCNDFNDVVNKLGGMDFTCVDLNGERSKYVFRDANAEVAESKTSPTEHCSTSTAPPIEANRSRKKRGKKPSMKLKDKDFFTQIIPRTNQHMRKKIVTFVTSAGGGRTRGRSELASSVMLQCEGQYASVQNCLTVLCSSFGGVDDNYVRAAAALYTRMWKHKFKESSLRIMLDPTVGIRLLQEKYDDPADWTTTLRVVKGCARGLVGTSSLRVYVVFIPMLEKGHWWCAAYCVNSEEIWVMDSGSRGPLEEHSRVIDKLNAVVDKFLFAFDDAWVCDQLHKWPRKVVKVERQQDGYSCGVYMLAAIKNCAERFQEEYALPGPLEDEREWLLTDDLMSDFNEAKGSVKEMVGAVSTSQ